MNTHHKLKHSSLFSRQWLEEVLIQCRRVKGLLFHFRSQAHLNPRYTLYDTEIDLDLDTILRIEINKAMVQDENQFMVEWNYMGKMIYEYGNEHGDEFNKQYEKTLKRK